VQEHHLVAQRARAGPEAFIETCIPVVQDLAAKPKVGSKRLLGDRVWPFFPAAIVGSKGELTDMCVMNPGRRVCHGPARNDSPPEDLVIRPAATDGENRMEPVSCGFDIIIGEHDDRLEFSLVEGTVERAILARPLFIDVPDWQPPLEPLDDRSGAIHAGIVDDHELHE
jgi:hypothetical protein